MSNASFIDKLTETKDGMRLYQQERAIFEATELLCQMMNEQNITRSELAQLLGKTKGYVTQLLDGRANMTIRTISDAFFALGRTLHFQDGLLQTQREHAPLLQFSWQSSHNQWHNMKNPTVESGATCFLQQLAG